MVTKGKQTFILGGSKWNSRKFTTREKTIVFSTPTVGEPSRIPTPQMFYAWCNSRC